MPSASPSILRSQISKPLLEQLPLRQIKSEPLEHECKPAVITPPTLTTVSAGIFNGGAAAPLHGTVQAVVLPTVGLVSPISINLADLQNALKVAVDGSVIRQALEGNAKAPGQLGAGLSAGMLRAPPQQLISAISLPIVGQDGNAKLIINCSLDPGQAQLTAHSLKTEPEAGDTYASQKGPEDLTVRPSGPRPETGREEKTTKTCILCDNRPGGLEALHALKADAARYGAAGVDRCQSAVAALLSEGGLCGQSKDVLSLLKACSALNAEPTKEELARISDSASLPVHAVKRWLDKMQPGQVALGAPTPPSEEEDMCDTGSVVALLPGKNTSPSATQDSPTEATPAEADGTHSSPGSPPTLSLPPASPAAPQSTDGPLDLSLPRQAREEDEKEPARVCPAVCSSSADGDQPLNLTCTKKEGFPLWTADNGPLALFAHQPSANGLEAVSTMTTMQCLRALTTNDKQTILIPQLAYTYTTTAQSPAGSHTQDTVHLNGVTVSKRLSPLSQPLTSLLLLLGSQVSRA